MRRVSKKRAREIRQAKPGRDQFAEEFGRCMICGKRSGLETHEIARGSHRRAAYGRRCCWLRLCRDCHDACGRYALWPVERQLALKLLRDSEHYDLEAFNAVRPRDIHAITQSEVNSWLPTIDR